MDECVLTRKWSYFFTTNQIQTFKAALMLIGGEVLKER